jgi:hypothetical protein
MENDLRRWMRLVEGDAGATPVGNQMTKLKMSRWGPQNEYFSIPVEYRKVPISDPKAPYPEPKFGIDRDGQAYYTATHYPDKAQIDRAIDAYLAPFGADTYVRSTLRRDDYNYLKAGTHRGSTNHNTGKPEGGLSVSHSLEFPSNYGYLVQGTHIGSGSDFEPLIDTSTARPTSRLMKGDTLIALQREAINARIRQLGLSSDEYRALVSGHKKIIMPEPSR